MMLNKYLFPQLLGTVGSQLDLTGWHIRAPPSASARAQHTTTIIRISAVHLKALVMNIRRKNTKTEILAVASNVGCRIEPAKKTCLQQRFSRSPQHQ